MAMLGLLNSVRSESNKVVFGRFFRVLCAGFFFATCNAHAAVVSLVTPPSSDGSTYSYGGQTYSIFQNLVDNTDPFGSNAGGEELIWLGAHQTWVDVLGGPIDDPGVGPTAIDVNVSGAAGSTVSLVLSSAQVDSWNISVAPGIKLNNVFIIADGGGAQNIDIDGVPRALLPGGSDTAGDVNLRRSDTTANCGYEYLEAASGCNTFQTLGLIENDSLTLLNELEFMQLQAGNSVPLKLTSFNGSYYVNQFDVQLENAPIPLPAAGWLFGLALASLATARANYATRQRQARC